QQPVLDDRPAPWILYAIITALAIFLIHNLIDFSLYENGPMMMFALLCGCVLGVRAPSVAGTRRRPLVVIAALAAGATAWLIAAIFFVLPIAQAESNARAADDAIRAGNLPLAGEQLAHAFRTSPVANADYAARAAR